MLKPLLIDMPNITRFLKSITQKIQSEIANAGISVGRQ